MSFRPSYFVLKKCRQILRQSYYRYKKKKHLLTEEQKNNLERHLQTLQTALIEKNSQTAKEQVGIVEKLTNKFLPKSSFEKMQNMVLGLGVALCLAILIRLVWFELYEIPTGSMRPTLKEKDRLIVSKTTFGINIPLSVGHFYFSPSLVERNGIFVFTGENMDMRDVDTKYFYIFPGKKQYIKRLMGKPGDTLYFYGGLIYGIDKEGNNISPLLQPARLDKIEHIPFLGFEEKVSTSAYPINGIYSPVVLKQMNESIAKLSVNSSGIAIGKMLTSDSSISYGDLWGIGNFGMARLLTKEQLPSEKKDLGSEGVLYLEIKHSPSLQNLKVRKDERGRMRPMFQLSSSFIPLNESHLKTLFSNLYTVRFIVKNGMAYSYGRPKSSLQSPFLPKLPGVPDGMYEFYYGKAYKISFQGIALELPKDHPLYDFSLERIQLFYNLGIEFDTRFSPEQYSPYFPRRYAYFRDGSLYTLGAPLLTADDPTLAAFVAKEEEKQAKSTSGRPYIAFLDKAPPLLPDGQIDSEFIKKYGLTIPEKMYLALGDNHAVSADSRDFGFVPEDNIRGAPDLIFWPPGNRFGHPNQPPYPFFNYPRTLIWVLAGSAIFGSIYLQRRRNKLPFF